MTLHLSLNLRLLPVDEAANKTAALLALDTAVEADILVPDEAPDDIGPALVAGQVLVEGAGGIVDGGQTGPRDGREVVVLVVVADVVGKPVERAVVRVCLGDGDLVGGVTLGGSDGVVDVVLGDEVTGQRVQATGQEGREQQVEQGVRGDVVEKQGVEAKLDGQVQVVDPGEGNAVDGHGTEGVEEDLESAEEGLAENRVEHEGLESGGQIGIKTVDAEGLVVGEVVGTEGGAVGDSDGEVGEDGEQAVDGRAAGGEVVGDLVDGEEEVLVGGGADNVGDSPELEGPEGGVAEEVGHGELEGDDAEDDVLGQGLGTAELGDLEERSC